MRNPRITKKEQGLLKGACRRVFSRSDLRRAVIEAAIVKHSDPKRKRVQTWCLCASCGQPEAKSNVVVDHIIPVIELTSSLDAMTWDEFIDRLWCDTANLQALCEDCHHQKTLLENSERRKHKKLAKSK